MGNFAVRCATVSVLVCAIVVLAGCGSTPLVAINPSAVMLLPGQTFQFSADLGAGVSLGTAKWEVNGVVGGESSVGTISGSGLYTAPSTFVSQPINVGVHGYVGRTTITLFNPQSFSPGVVAATQNPLVASYTVTLPAGASAHVQFGRDTNYGLTTSEVQAPAGGPVTVFVAGMRATTPYHIQGILDMVDGSHLLDADQTFTTGAIDPSRLPTITTQATGAGTPSDGIELLSLNLASASNLLSTVATDLDGNVIWYYDSTEWPFPVKPLANGHMLVLLAPGGTVGANEIREIDLAGNTINAISPNQVNQSLAGKVPWQIVQFHHDVLVLPNGHMILLANYTQSNVAGVPAGTSVIGDALIDWDPQLGAVWTWSAFDHLDPTRAPYGIANGVEDWTHANAIIASSDDGNLILSMRNQNWIIKINYQNGAGDGSILWHFGPEGDFTLPGQQAPIEWNYGQHYPTIVSSNSAGVFSLMFFNNGNNRFVDSSNTVCGSTGAIPCFSSVPIFQVDESAKTASVLWEDKLASYYSVCCGDALILPNGNVEFDIADDLGTPGYSHIQEVTQTQTPQLIWNMDIKGQLAYRGFRISSLYPGQVWSATALSSGPRGTGAKSSRDALKH